MNQNSCTSALKNIGRHILLALAWFFRIIIVLVVVGTLVARFYPVFFVALVLAAILFAVVRSRLVSFNQFFSRSLLYTILSLSLALFYFAGLAAWQFVRLFFNPGSPQVATDPGAEAEVIINMLFVIILFNPLRLRLQAWIDKRFYREQYDATKIIASFTSTLREEIDLDQLNARLLTVARETLYPTNISLWLYERPSEEELAQEGSAPEAHLAQWQPRQSTQTQTPSNRLLLEPDPLRTTMALDIEFSATDPLIVQLLNNGDLLEVQHASIDSPVWRALRDSNIVLTVPLVTHRELVGLLNLGPKMSGQDYSTGDKTLLTMLAAQVAPALRVAQLVREQQLQVRERGRIEQELRTAEVIQRSLLPKTVPSLSDWLIETYYQPAREVGGDFYDFLQFDDGRLGLVIGDVADKGVPSALVMASTRSMLRAAALASDSPGAVLEQVNALLVADMPPMMFVTCFYAILDPNTGKMRYANAGHNLPYRQQKHHNVELDARGMPLGLMPNMRYDEQETTIGRDEGILFFSDGLVEAHNKQGEMFGAHRLKDLLAQEAEQENGQRDTLFTELLIDELTNFTGHDWEQEDDITLLTLYRIPEVQPEQRDSMGNSENIGNGENREDKGQSEQLEQLLECTAESAPGNEQQVMERVAEVVRPLGLPIKQLANLKTAVAEAVMNAMEHGNRYQPDKTVGISVLASPKVIVVKVRDQGEGSGLPEEGEQVAPDLEAKLAGEQSPRGWGLFLIKSLVDEMHTSNTQEGHIIELTMFR